jgi:hypothetical protein
MTYSEKISQAVPLFRLYDMEKQIPHRLKPVRDDKQKSLLTAQLKLCPSRTLNSTFRELYVDSFHNVSNSRAM